MLSFAAEFPVHSARSVEDFLSAIRLWVSGSPHTALNAPELQQLGSEGSWELSKGNESLQSLRAAREGYECASIRYARTDAGLQWSTSVTFSKARDSCVAVRVFCDSIHPAVQLPPAKKPVIVRVLLRELGGGDDGDLQVSSSPTLLKNVDVDLAARLLGAGSGCRLPIVYVSANYRGGYALDPARLSNDLAGMAHVVVEPNRPFSLRLKIDANSENVYGGAIGIYWPDGGGRRAFFIGRGMAYETAGEIAAAIIEEVRTALTNRRPLSRCTWGFAQELVSRNTLDQLKSSGSHKVEEYIETFDAEMASKVEELEDAEREIARLKAELRIYEARSARSSGITLSTGEEQDLFPNEITGVVLDALRGAAASVTKDSRRDHILQSVIGSNSLNSEAGSRRDLLKELLRGHESLTQKTRKGLEGLGFTVLEEGKHLKLLYQGDDRYTFSLPKSGSDHRGGLNAAGDIGRLLY